MCEPQRLRRPVAQRAAQGGAQIVVLVVQPGEHRAGVDRDEARFEPFCEPHEVAPVTRLDAVALAGLVEALAGVLAQWDEQAKSRLGVVLLGQHERLRHEGVEQAENVRLLDAVARADLLDRREPDAPGERAEPAEQRALRCAEQVVAPIDRGGHGLLAGERRPRPRAEHRQRVGQAPGDLVRRQDADAGRRQLDRQRHPFDAATDRRDGRGGRVVEREARRRRSRAFGEQPYRLHRRQLDGRREPGRRHGQRVHAPCHLAGDLQRLAARGQQLQVRALRQQRLGEARARGDEVLAVVEHEQHRSVAHMRGDRRLGRATGARFGTERRARRGGDERLVGEAAELDEPDPVGVLPANPLGDREREARLPAPSRAGERDRAGSTQLVAHVLERARSPDEAGQRQREVARRQRRTILRRARRRRAGEDLPVQPLRLGLGMIGDLALQPVAQEVVLRQRALAPPAARVEPHQLTMRALVKRILDHGALQQGDGGDLVAAGAILLGELDEQAEEALAQHLAAGGRPLLEAVLGQQLAAVAVDRLPQRRRLTGPLGDRGRGLELVHVDGRSRPKREHVVRELDPARRVVGVPERASRDVQRLSQVVGGSGRIAVRPEDLHDLLAMQASPRGEREQLDEAAGLAQAPCPLGERASRDEHAKPAEQFDAQSVVVGDRDPPEP
ncbi:MAG: hypothetical protein Q8O56_08600 [Solirubrobacteraceae bacterium]|nr:hypothetical protein [Solirubrobacteraceae bacterium]